MLKKTLFMIILIFINTCLYANNKEIDFTEEEHTFIKNNKTINVAMLKNFKPFSYIQDNKHIGMTKDILELLSQRSGLKFDIKLDTWSNNLKKFKNKKVSIITAISYKAAREDFTLFTSPYYEIGVYLFKNKKDKQLLNYQDLKGKVVGINKGIFYKQQLEELGAKVIEFENNEDRTHALAFGDIDCFLASFTSGISSIEKLSITNIKPAFEVNEIRKEDLRFGINVDQKILNSIITKTLKNISKKEFKDLEKKWIINLPSENVKKIKFTLEEQKWIRKHRTIKVHNEQAWIPFNFFDKVPEGFSIDYMNLLAKKIGINVKYITGPSWNEFLQMMKNNKLDVMLNIVKTDERLKYLQFTKPYKITTDRIYTKNNLRITKLEDLNGKTIAIEKGFYNGENLKKYYPNIKIKYYNNIENRLKAVSFEEVDATITIPEVAQVMLRRHLISNVSAQSEANFKDAKLNGLKLRLATSKDNIVLNNLLNKAMDNITYQEKDLLEQKWFHSDLNKIEQKITPQEKKYLKNNIFKVATTNSWAPFNFNTDKEILTGIAVDYLNIVSEKLDLQSNINIKKSFKDVLNSIENGESDLTFSTTNTKERQSYALFSNAYEKFPIAIAALNEKNFIPNASLLDGKKVAVGKDYSAYFLLKEKYSHINFVFTKNTKEALELVKSKEVYAAVDILPALQFNINKYFDKSIKISGTTDVFFEIKFMVDKKHALLLSSINKAIDSIHNDKKNQIYRKWLLASKKGIDPVLFYNILIIIGMIFIISLLWNYYILKSKRLIEKQKLELKEIHQELLSLNLTLEDRVKIEVKKNEEQQLMMFQQSKHAQMGEMISMIAHQWRQPINTLSLILQNILFKYNLGKINEDVLTELIGKGNKQIYNMSNTIDDFRDFFKPEKEAKLFKINKSINHAIDILEPIFKKFDINISVDTQEEIILKGYPNKFSQVIINILNNSKDALIENKIEHKKIQIILKQTEENIQLIISDNAQGIPEDIINDIFDPYFSTKSEKIGTGLGLYMSKMIIEDHMNGQLIAINNEDGVSFIMKFKK